MNHWDFYCYCYCLLLGTTTQQPLQHLCLLPQEAQPWLTGGGTNRLDRSRGLGYSSLRLTNTSLITTETTSPRLHPSGIDCRPLSHTNTHTHSQTTWANSGLSDGVGPGALAFDTGDWLICLSQWGAIVSYGNVLPSWGQEPRRAVKRQIPMYTFVLLSLWGPFLCCIQDNVYPNLNNSK